MKKNNLLLRKLIVITMLVALCFGATRINIPMPTGDMVHLGNFVMILSALLLGGLEGGIVGSLGMGIYDLVFFSNRPSTIIRTFILKFIVGFIVGYIFRLVLKKKYRTQALLIASTIFFVLLFGVSLTLFIIGDKADLSFKAGLSANVINFLGTGKNVKISLYLPIFSILFAIGMLFAIIFERKLTNRSKAALFAITVAVLINILGEFVLRWFIEGLFNIYVNGLNDGFTVSLVTATTKIPGSVITGFLTVFLAALVYEPVYRGVKTLDVFKDNTLEYEEEQNDDNNTIDNENISLDSNN